MSLCRNPAVGETKKKTQACRWTACCYSHLSSLPFISIIPLLLPPYFFIQIYFNMQYKSKCDTSYPSVPSITQSRSHVSKCLKRQVAAHLVTQAPWYLGTWSFSFWLLMNSCRILKSSKSIPACFWHGRACESWTFAKEHVQSNTSAWYEFFITAPYKKTISSPSGFVFSSTFSPKQFVQPYAQQ